MRPILMLLAIALLTAAGLAQDKPVPAEEVAATMQLPEGFRATVFAAEPDLVQPISFTFDDRGRMWVVECLSYPTWNTEGQGRDRVSIFEDRNGDGRFDSKKVFYDKGTNLSSIQLGFGGVWLCSVPNLVFIPDRDRNDIPDGPPEVKLDGWDLKARHNVVNELQWGPDGWMYGCNGILSNSLVGKPGTPAERRVALNCGVWRYHPAREAFEVVASGTTNPWGLDFDDYGEAFITNCVIHHLWHVVPGAHFERMFGEDLTSNTYSLLPSCADYIHWGGGVWYGSRGGTGIHDKPGGGHAHSGAMVYLGENWPAEHRNRLFTCNLHGRRLNSDILQHHASGYKAQRAPDLLFVNDPWFRGLALHAGPDGGVFLSDWSDTGECHDYLETDIERGNGRIYKITFGQPKPIDPAADLAALDDLALARLQFHKNDWLVRHSRRILHERAAGQAPRKDDVRELLREGLLGKTCDVPQRLRALWALFALGEIDASLGKLLVHHAEAHVRAWAVRLDLDDRHLDWVSPRELAALAASDPSPRVRLALASGLQRLPAEQAWPIAEALIVHAEDAEDANLPLMIWYGLEPLLAKNPDAVRLIGRSKLPLLREYIARRLAEE